MEKICGFLDKRGVFHKTENECKTANLKINIKDIENTLSNFSVTIENYLFRNSNWKVRVEYRHHENEIKEIVAKAVLSYSDEFIKIINKKKEMEKTLDLLKKEKEYQDKWWIKFVWWK
jgi:hypothetical protein